MNDLLLLQAGHLHSNDMLSELPASTTPVRHAPAAFSTTPGGGKSERSGTVRRYSLAANGLGSILVQQPDSAMDSTASAPPTATATPFPAAAHEAPILQPLLPPLLRHTSASLSLLPIPQAMAASAPPTPAHDGSPLPARARGTARRGRGSGHRPSPRRPRSASTGTPSSVPRGHVALHEAPSNPCESPVKPSPRYVYVFPESPWSPRTLGGPPAPSSPAAGLSGHTTAGQPSGSCMTPPRSGGAAAAGRSSKTAGVRDTARALGATTGSSPPTSPDPIWRTTLPYPHARRQPCEHSDSDEIDSAYRRDALGRPSDYHPNAPPAAAAGIPMEVDLPQYSRTTFTNYPGAGATPPGAVGDTRQIARKARGRAAPGPYDTVTEAELARTIRHFTD